MDTAKNLAILILATASVVATGVALNRAAAPSQVNVGALSSPDLQSQYIGVGGLQRYHYNYPLSTGTTTVCAIQNPTTGTTTVVSAGIKFDVSSTTATILTIGKGNTITATTTLIGTAYGIAANAQAFVLASTSPAAGAATVLGPSQWLNFSLQGGIGTMSPTGACHAVMEVY